MPDGDTFTYALAFVLGAVIGSFLNVCIYRIPRNESIIRPGSHCTSCNKPISFYHNIPILSYILLRGRCSGCNSKISSRYPFVELLTGLLFLITAGMFGLSIESLVYLMLISSLIVITFIDLEHKIIPNAVTYPGIAVGILYGAVITDWGSWGEVTANYTAGKLNFFSLLRELPVLDSIFGVILGAGTLLLIAYAYKAVKKRDGMGMGDVKLLAMIGSFFGWEGVLFAIFLGSILGSVSGIAIIVSGRGDMKYALPFGPFLSVAAVIYIFTGGFKIFI